MKDGNIRSSVSSPSGPLGFGKYMANSMVMCRYSERTGWDFPSVGPYRALELDPCALVLHYGQAIYEGMKAYRAADSSISLFRPECNAARFRASARRMSMAEMPEALFVEAVSLLASVERDMVPEGPECALYLRPVLIADEAAFGVRRANQYLFFVVATPAEPLYRIGVPPFKLVVSDDYMRAAPNGGGDAKTSGNYGRTLIALEAARRNGFNNVLWLDPVRRDFLEEAGITNIFVRRGACLITPPLNGRILPGVMRDTVLQLAREWGFTVAEEEISVTALLREMDADNVDEIFLTGTAVHLAPVGSITRGNTEHRLRHQSSGVSLMERLSSAISDIQQRRVPDPRGWMREVWRPVERKTQSKFGRSH
jgi:branched-chain amino acid aminotransferase